MSKKTEAWLRGPLPDIELQLQPVAHSLVHLLEELEHLEIQDHETWSQSQNLTPVGFHLRHIAGSIDRLFTYAQGSQLSETQQQELREEKEIGDESKDDLLVKLRATIDRAMEQLRQTSTDSITEKREVGRAKLPSTVIGLLVHAAEHAQRHLGQVTTTLIALRRQQPIH